MAGDNLPSLSIIIETSTWHHGGQYDLTSLLKSLRQQSYPSEKLQIILPLVPEAQSRWDSLSHEFGEVQAVRLENTMNYYQVKHAGVEYATGDVIAFLDADNIVGPDWAGQMVGALASNPNVLAVHGRSRFRSAPFSRMWDAIWWVDAFAPEGPIKRIFASNDVAFRGDFIRRNFYPDPNLTRGVWERITTQRIRNAGGLVWLNPGAIWFHDIDTGLRDTLQRALSRGAHMVHARIHAPKPTEKLQKRFIYLFPWLGLPYLMLKDSWRVLATVSRNGLGPAQLWRIPFYVGAAIALDLVAFVGMLLAAYGGKAIAPP